MNQRGLCSKRGVMKVLVCAGLILLTGERNSSAPQQSGADIAASAERGRKEFVQSCGFCHGADATGARGPDLMRSPLVAHDVKGDQIGQVIRQGRPDKGMPAMPLSDAQILDIAAFLHARAERLTFHEQKSVLEECRERKLLRSHFQNKQAAGNMPEATAGEHYFGYCT